MVLKVHFAENLPGKQIIYYTLCLIADNAGIALAYSPSPFDADLKITTDADADISLCLPFYQYLTNSDFESIKTLGKNSYHFTTANGSNDLLASIFYLVNCIQEYGETQTDQYGRYPYNASIQNRENILQQNIIQKLIDEFISTQQVFKNQVKKKRKSGFFLTHDIDTVYGAKNQNGRHALNTYKYYKIPGLLLRHYFGTPDWINMDKIAALESQFGFTSAFYWLVHKDKANADYTIDAQQIQKQIVLLKEKNFEICLHKSLRETSLKDELALLNELTYSQRYHFLKFRLPNAWNDLEEAGIKLDTSLGFSEDFGFRNCYGLPFMPFNLKKNQVYKLVEVPMNIMDRTFFNQNKPIAAIEKELIDWLDKNKENTVITINFHNNFFDKMLYEGYDRLYLTLLKYFKEEGLTCETLSTLSQQFYKPEAYTLKTP